MTGIRLDGGEAFVDGVRLAEIADSFGTPTHVYSRLCIESQVQAVRHAFQDLRHLLCYSVKANDNVSLLALLADSGTGFDVVSGNELECVLRAGGDASKVVFSGVGKQAEELDFALREGVLSINVESVDELELLEERAKLAGLIAPLSLRVNPDIAVDTHPYIATGVKSSKFGIPIERAEALIVDASQSAHLHMLGLACHLGSQLTDLAPLDTACEQLLGLMTSLQKKGIHIGMIDLGGGFGVRYAHEPEFDVAAYARAIKARLGARDVLLVTEPGRFLIANAGVLLTRVIRTKPSEPRDFAVVDAGMNDLIRPSLYQAYHAVGRDGRPAAGASAGPWDIVGPVCETADTLASQRELEIAQGDLLFIESCGAYTSVMSSNYNARDRAAEVLVEDARARLIRRRECLADRLALETPYLRPSS